MTAYAKGTQVPAERTRSEIERLLLKHGADQFSYGSTGAKGVVMFRMERRYIRIEIPMPKRGDPKTSNWAREKGVYYGEDRYQAEVRRRWRSMLLYVKAKLESVASDIVTFEDAFMAHVVLPNRQTVGEYMKPQIEMAYEGGHMPKLLEFGG